MFLSQPEIDFEFEGAARLATKLPAIKERIRAELVEELGGEAVFPRRLTLPLSWSADPEMVWHPQVTGMLVVRLMSVKGLPKKGEGRGPMLTFVMISLKEEASGKCLVRTSPMCTPE